MGLIPDMIACNLAAKQVDEYLDTGYLMPVVVPPINRKLFGQPVGLWCVGDGTVPSDTRIGYGGKTEWRKLTASPDNWLYCMKVDLELLMSPQNLMDRNPVDELNRDLGVHGMRFVNSVAMGGSQACAADNVRTMAIWDPCRANMVEQIKGVWYDPRFHISVRLQEKMVANKQMSAQDFWEMAGPVHASDCGCPSCGTEACGC